MPGALTTLERVAKAMCEAENLDFDDGLWREMSIFRARAAFEAMKFCDAPDDEGHLIKAGAAIRVDAVLASEVIDAFCDSVLAAPTPGADT